MLNLNTAFSPLLVFTEAEADMVIDDIQDNVTVVGTSAKIIKRMEL